ncbi:MAG: protein translocase subunit SecD [Dethiobacter sp.]|jgi:protein-export SecD/SecF family membrane protein|nr:protein translocase subunit SecD [Dethiobacter sp.]
MRKNRLLTLSLVVLLLLALSAVSFQHALSNINLGLDLRGGVYVLLQAVETGDSGGDTLDRAITVLRNRIDSLGVTEPLIQKEGDDRIRIELAGYEDQRRAKEVIGTTAMLRFIGPDNEVILTGGDLKDARASYDDRNLPAVSLEFNPEGSRLFAEATEKFLGQPIIIYLDEQLVSAPTVQAIIRDGKAQITGIRSLDDARSIALMLRSGALPVDLIELETRSVGPSLGQDSLNRSVRAGIAGFILVLIFMIVYYKLFGVIANVALMVYVSIVFAVLVAINATLTLPGIAGLILSVGMAVDANVIIFERVKEELRAGRTMRTSINAGFERAFRAILDANVTTLIAAAVLFRFGDGPIRGFAVTLSIGIIVSMFTAIILTRYLLRQAVRAEVLRTPETAEVRV